MTHHRWPLPEKTTKQDGDTRRVGVELEMQGIDIPQLARVTAQAVHGEIHRDSGAEFRIESPEHGEYRVEIDQELLKAMWRRSEERRATAADNFDDFINEALTAAGSLVIPCEVVTPAIPMTEVAAPVDALTDALRLAGAEGTGKSPLFAFGLHLNVEPPDLDVATVLAYMKAFVCLFDWLAGDGRVDLTRRITPYIDRFPWEYENLIASPDYWPDWDGLIDDYLRWNATRNRALDMLPLLGDRDESRIRAVVDDVRVKTRPTFHYRLANCSIDEPDWSVEEPWRGWLQIEHLAGDRDALNDCCRALMVDRERVLHRLDDRWRKTVTRWLRRF